MVVEANSGKVLIAANSNVARPVASLTKIATASIATDWAEATGTDPNKTMITVPAVATMLGGPNPMALQPGDQLTLRDALYSAMLGSDNIAALAIADFVGKQLLQARGKSGDPVAAFIVEMNQLAKGLGMTNTKFVNPHGLEFPRKVGTSTAADMARLSIYAMRRPAITFVARQKERQVTVQGPSGSRSYNVKNTNELLGEPGVIGLKTGTTEAAGPCVAIAADRDPAIITGADGQKKAVPRRIMIVLLNSPDRFNRARSLMGQGWSVYDRWSAAGAPINNRKNEILDVPNLRD
ncbi:MAG: hypothetical protein JWO82_2194 [Akkermansiaceae bacterium]|nr:hypothetical protein [Akkermansiaceae bacterium]